MAGFLLGSLNGIWPWKEIISTRLNSKGEMVPLVQKNMLPEGDAMLQGVGLMLAGAALLLLLDRLGASRKKA
jgi:putative membrane protein